MNSVNEEQISSCLKDEHIAASGALGVASANQVATLCVNENLISYLKNEHIADRGIGGIGDGGLGWYVPCVNEHVSLHLVNMTKFMSKTIFMSKQRLLKVFV